MTSATSATFQRRRARIAAAAAGLAAALALTACSGDGDGDGDSKEPSATASSSASASPTATASADGSADDDLQGSWLATTDGKAVALVVNGKQAALFSTGGSVCSGTAGEAAGMRMIRLNCTDGNKDRSEGMISELGSSSMKVAWEGFKTEEFQKSEGGKVPSGFPTDLPSAS
ncbi:hypothetical protein [Streptomyces cavernae]|uniref:hypothetical protein n=1 Tax=Streptomyces cavernae TaxID=2259034 RepID=UPI000FEBB820|nr:hypothetical protein [Streptomyces cavernae]